MKRVNVNMKKNQVLFLAMLQIVLMLLALPTAGYPSSVSLSWAPSTDPTVTGYKVYYQANSAALPFNGTGATEGSAPIDLATATTANIDGLDPGSSYYFAVTAYNATGTESPYSNIVQTQEMVPPVVSISSPSANSSLTGSVSVSANATDNVGVTRVEFYVNGVLQGTDTSGPYVFTWNTSAVAPGSYTLSAKAYDAAGNVGQSAGVTVTVAGDTTPPTVALSAPANGATVSGTVPISASASDNIGVAKVEIYDNGALSFVSNQSSASFSWNTTLAANGSHTIVAKAYDAAGNTGSASITVNVLNDTIAPTVAISAPLSGSTVGGAVSVTTSATDNVGVTSVEFYVNGALQATDTSAPYTFTWNTAGLANGSYILSAKAYDAVGNVGQSGSVTVTVFNDTVAPSVSITSPVTGSTATGTVSVATAATDNVGVTRVELYVNNVLQATDTSAPYTFNWNSAAVANGSYTLTAKAYDAAGNVGQSGSVIISVSNDTTAPSVSISSPTAGSTATGTVAITASATDNVGVSKVEFYLNGALLASTNSAPYTFTWNTATGANGSYTLTAKAYDAAGNVGQSGSVTVTVFNDTTAPAISITSPVSGSTASGTVTVAASASDNVGVTKVEFYLNGVLQVTDTGAPYVFTWNTANVANGSYTLTAKAYDAAGNIGQSTSTVTVFNDTTAPTVSISAPAGGSTVTSGSVVTVSANASDNVAVTRVEFYVNGVLQATSSTAPYSFNWNSAGVADGAYTFTAKAYDAAGNVGQSSSVTVNVVTPVVDTTAPVVTITAPTSTALYTNKATISASATDNVAVTKMELYVDGGLKLSTNQSSFSAVWNFGKGSHTIAVKAYDAANNVSTASQSIYRY